MGIVFQIDCDVDVDFVCEVCCGLIVEFVQVVKVFDCFYYVCVYCVLDFGVFGKGMNFEVILVVFFEYFDYQLYCSVVVKIVGEVFDFDFVVCLVWCCVNCFLFGILFCLGMGVCELQCWVVGNGQELEWGDCFVFGYQLLYFGVSVVVVCCLVVYLCVQ